MTAYAAQTEVPADRSRGEIERTVTRFGARSFAYGWEGSTAVIGFELGDRHYRFLLPLPAPTDRKFLISPAGRTRTPKAAAEEHAQAVRQRWRALALIVKAKFAAVEAGISTVEIEFMANTVLPDGRTVGEHTLPAIAKAYADNTVPSMLALPAGGAR
jgi:hypothetical protein